MPGFDDTSGGRAGLCWSYLILTRDLTMSEHGGAFLQKVPIASAVKSVTGHGNRHHARVLREDAQTTAIRSHLLRRAGSLLAHDVVMLSQLFGFIASHIS